MEEREELFSYRNLQAYQSSKQLVLDIYYLLKHFPKEVIRFFIVRYTKV